MALQHLTVNDKGVANGVATLDGGGKVPSSQLPATALNNWSRLFWAFNMGTAANYTWNSVTVAAPNATLLNQRHRLYACAGTGTSKQGVYVNYVLPSNYVAGTDIKITANLITNATGGAVYWTGVTKPTGGGVLGGTAETVWTKSTLVGVAGFVIIPTVVTVSGAGLVPGSAIAVMLYRDAGDAGDDIGGDTYIHSIQIEQV